MSVTDSPITRTRKLSPFRIVASAAFLVFGLVSLFSQGLRDLPYLFNNFGSVTQNPYWPVLIQYFLTAVLSPLVAVVLVLLGLLPRKATAQLIFSAIFFVLALPLSWLLQAYFVSQGVWYEIIWTTQGINNEDLLGWVGLGLLSVGTIFALVAKLTESAKPDQANPRPEQVIVEREQGASGVSNLPIFALIGSFLFPIVGVVLGHISLSQMNKGQISAQNRGMAKAGLILGYVFIGLGIATFVLIIVISLIVYGFNS